MLSKVVAAVAVVGRLMVRMGMSLEIGLNNGSLWALFRAYTLPAESSVSWVPLAKLSEARPCVLI